MSLPPSGIYYSTDSISPYFDAKGHNWDKTMEEVKNEIVQGRMTINQLPKMSVLKKGDTWVTTDNHRLWIFRELEKIGICHQVPVTKSYRAVEGTIYPNVKVEYQKPPVPKIVVQKDKPVCKTKKEKSVNRKAKKHEQTSEQTIRYKRGRRRKCGKNKKILPDDDQDTEEDDHVIEESIHVEDVGNHQIEHEESADTNNQEYDVDDSVKLEDDTDDTTKMEDDVDDPTKMEDDSDDTDSDDDDSAAEKKNDQKQTEKRKKQKQKPDDEPAVPAYANFGTMFIAVIGVLWLMSTLEKEGIFK